MAWKYKAGLMLLACVVFIWVTSAEVTQKIFEAYRQPFAISYLGAALMVIYLPLSLVKDRLLHFLKKKYVKLQRSCSDSNQDNGPDSPRWKRDDNDLELQKLMLSFSEDGKGSQDGSVSSRDDSTKWTLREVAKACIYLAPLWLVTEYLSNAALANTSVASTTILSSTSALFTLMFGTLLGQDKFNVMKFIAVLVTITGVAMTTLGNTWSKGDTKVTLSRPSEHDVVGDVLGLLSAVCYGLFTVLLKRIAGHDGEAADVQKVFGFIGLYTLVGLWWLAWPLQLLGLEPRFKIPTSKKVDEVLLANGLIGSVLSDYFWALSVVWTTPLVATVGMSLTIPVAMIADILIYERHYSAIYVLGSVQVFAGFVIANLTDQCTRKLGF